MILLTEKLMAHNIAQCKLMARTAAAQNLYLATESLGAGACALLSYDQPGADALIGVDGTDEFVIYLACVGKLP